MILNIRAVLVLNGFLGLKRGYGIGEKVAEDFAAILRAYGLRMKLDAPVRKGAVAQRHDDTVFCFRDQFQCVGQSSVGHQRVVSCDFKGLGNAVEQWGAVMMDAAYTAMHGLWRSDDAAAVMQRQALVTETDAQHGYIGIRQYVHGAADVSSLMRRAGTGRENDTIMGNFMNLTPG
ncbi:hypothetical protein AU490_00335 [Lonsdalea populi]|uniref:Uncharacterized protein n=2 Tax=Lonsdalea TaxID=1082702 RepID=A0ACD1JFG4_9GAMM|nr:hypothetical protein AU499_01090 [Lonsdalea populi]RAT15610.1 hypothetical protein AU485_03245 [Lonsdalea quercina]RAT18248.1 hypothetical protein AU486_01730 [Lonsdalea quercina]RAT23835.1 hypothetical protein AU487_00320 [Lonsdalea populi]RAT26107.1 hypothetical protein AU489_05670 [Lonsdalea populi]